MLIYCLTGFPPSGVRDGGLPRPRRSSAAHHQAEALCLRLGEPDYR